MISENKKTEYLTPTIYIMIIQMFKKFMKIGRIQNKQKTQKAQKEKKTSFLKEWIENTYLYKQPVLHKIMTTQE